MLLPTMLLPTMLLPPPLLRASVADHALPLHDRSRKLRAPPPVLMCDDGWNGKDPDRLRIELERLAGQRSEAEMLASLESTDDAVAELWGLWFSERGPAAAKALQAADRYISEGKHMYSAAEAELSELSLEYSGWPEPINRRATLMYERERYPESINLCERVLSARPWHFGAISGMALCHAAMGDASAARLWEARKLPPLGSTARSRWVKNAVSEAESLARERTQ
jgi:hypothetical protein